MTRQTKTQALNIKAKEIELIEKSQKIETERTSSIIEQITILKDVLEGVRAKAETKEGEYPYTNTWDEEDEINFFKKRIIKLTKQLLNEKTDASPEIAKKQTKKK